MSSFTCAVLDRIKGSAWRSGAAEPKDRLREVVRFVNEDGSEVDIDIVYELIN